MLRNIQETTMNTMIQREKVVHIAKFLTAVGVFGVLLLGHVDPRHVMTLVRRRQALEVVPRRRVILDTSRDVWR